MARRTYVYKLRPSRAQETALVRTLDACRHVYNHALEHRREVYRATGHGVSKYAQLAELKDVRRLPGWEALRKVHCHPVGIDVGIAAFATLSTGERIENPRHADCHPKRVERTRRTQGTFRCVACAHGANADHNAAVNIVSRARARPVVEASENVAA